MKAGHKSSPTKVGEAMRTYRWQPKSECGFHGFGSRSLGTPSAALDSVIIANGPETHFFISSPGSSLASNVMRETETSMVVEQSVRAS